MHYEYHTSCLFNITYPAYCGVFYFTFESWMSEWILNWIAHPAIFLAYAVPWPSTIILCHNIKVFLCQHHLAPSLEYNYTTSLCMISITFLWKQMWTTIRCSVQSSLYACNTFSVTIHQHVRKGSKTVREFTAHLTNTTKMEWKNDLFVP